MSTADDQNDQHQGKVEGEVIEGLASSSSSCTCFTEATDGESIQDEKSNLTPQQQQQQYAVSCQEEQQHQPEMDAAAGDSDSHPVADDVADLQPAVDDEQQPSNIDNQIRLVTPDGVLVIREQFQNS